jgi:hypothetical protein
LKFHTLALVHLGLHREMEVVTENEFLTDEEKEQALALVAREVILLRVLTAATPNDVAAMVRASIKYAPLPQQQPPPPQPGLISFF